MTDVYFNSYQDKPCAFCDAFDCPTDDEHRRMLKYIIDFAGPCRRKARRTCGRDSCTAWKDYNLKEQFDFGTALILLKQGESVCRKGWNGKGIYIKLQMPDENSKMTLPYIYIVTTGLQTDNPDAPKGIVPWLASQTDLLSDDWMVVKND